MDFVSREQALARFRAMFRDLSSLPEDLGENPFPASLEVTLRADRQSPAEVERLAKAFAAAPGVREIQYDLLWIERLSTGVRLVRGLGAFLGGILVLAGVFTISNVIRLTIYAREDELDIMRLVGATRAYVKGPFVTEGVIQGGLGGLVAAASCGRRSAGSPAASPRRTSLPHARSRSRPASPAAGRRRHGRRPRRQPDQPRRLEV